MWKNLFISFRKKQKRRTEYEKGAVGIYETTHRNPKVETLLNKIEKGCSRSYGKIEEKKLLDKGIVISKLLPRSCSFCNINTE